MKKFLIMLLGVLMALPTFARDFTYQYEGQTLTYTVLDEEAKTVETKAGKNMVPGNNISGDLIIPSKVYDAGIEYTVEKIGDQSFMCCDNLISVVIPNSVKVIDTEAFEVCEQMTTLTIGNSVSEIKYRAFAQCISLQSVIIPNSVTTMGEDAFFYCRALTSLSIENGVTTIPNKSFRNCEALTSLNIGNSVTSIGEEAFYQCRSLESVVIPNSVTSIGMGAFNGCSNLKTVTFGSSVESIGSHAFIMCKLTDLVLPPSTKTIGNGAFGGYDLKNIVIGPNVTEIGNQAFTWNENLESVTITAVTPPVATDDSFSTYDCPLYVVPSENNVVLNAYANAAACWNRFSVQELTPITEVEIAGESSLTLNPGESVKLEATYSPADASLPYIFWRSTNPNIATVDDEGNVTIVDRNGGIQTRADEGNTCQIIAETLYSNGPIASVTITSTGAGVEDIMVEQPSMMPVRDNNIYNMQGMCIKRNATDADIDALTPGLYIIGGKKVVIK